MNNTEISNQTQAPVALNTGISVFDSGQFQQMWTIAEALAQGSLIPESLKGETLEVTKANCLRVVEQAARWGLSPFAVMDSASVVHGKLMWEGKLISAALTATLGVRLRYDYEGDGEQREVTVTGKLDGQDVSISGTVADWKTTGKNSPWDKMANRDQMLAYRGARQWARRYAPEVILGVYAPDEMEEVETLRDVTPKRRQTPVDPFAEAEAPKEEKPKPAKKKAEVLKPEGKQKKERYKLDVTIEGVLGPKSTPKGKEYYLIKVRAGKHLAEMTTFSTTLKSELEGVPMEELIEVIYTKDEQGRMTLEGWNTIDPLDAEASNEEGGLI